MDSRKQTNKNSGDQQGTKNSGDQQGTSNADKEEGDVVINVCLCCQHGMPCAIASELMSAKSSSSNNIHKSKGNDDDYEKISQGSDPEVPEIVSAPPTAKEDIDTAEYETIDNLTKEPNEQCANANKIDKEPNQQDEQSANANKIDNNSTKEPNQQGEQSTNVNNLSPSEVLRNEVRSAILHSIRATTRAKSYPDLTILSTRTYFTANSRNDNIRSTITSHSRLYHPPVSRYSTYSVADYQRENECSFDCCFAIWEFLVKLVVWVSECDNTIINRKWFVYLLLAFLGYYGLGLLNSLCVSLLANLTAWLWPFMHFMLTATAGFAWRMADWLWWMDEFGRNLVCDMAAHYCYRYKLLCDRQCSFLDRTIENSYHGGRRCC